MTPEEIANDKKREETPFEKNPDRVALRSAVRFAYDMQDLRIGEGNRAGQQSNHSPAQLSDHHRAFLERSSKALKDIEVDAFKEVKRLLKPFPIYTEFLSQQRGIGPAMAGVLLAYFDPYRAPTPSSFERYAGIAVDPQTGRADRLKRGVKASFDPWLKARLLGVLCGGFVRAQSDWACFYYWRKHRRVNQSVPECMACAGKPDERRKCKNCGGTGGPAPWGCNPAHRHKDANRYMLKMFLHELWIRWRTLEELPLRVPYQVEYLGHTHEKYDNPSEMMTYLVRRWKAGAFDSSKATDAHP